MKIKLLASWAGVDFSFVPGDVVEVSENDGTRLIERGLAEPGEMVEQQNLQPEPEPQPEPTPEPKPEPEKQPEQKPKAKQPQQAPKKAGRKAKADK